MTESILNFLQNYNIPPELIIFLISMCPLIELRGGLIAASILHIGWLKAFLICYIGNLALIPIVLIFVRHIFKFLKRFKPISKLIDKIEIRATRQSKKIQTYRFLGIMLFVGIPLPGTGAYSGSVVADLLDMRFRSSFLSIAFGVFIAGVIMLVLSYVIPGLFGF